jgi:hypothetical protein
MLHLTTKTEIQNGLKTVHVCLNGVKLQSFDNTRALRYTPFNVKEITYRAEDLAAEYIASLSKKLGGCVLIEI